MKYSILRKLFFSYVLFGITMGIVFPFYANFFVEWKPNMLQWFVLGCLIAGSSIGIINYLILKKILIAKIRELTVVLKDIAKGKGDLTKRLDESSKDEIGEMTKWFNIFIDKLEKMILQIKMSTICALSETKQIEVSINENANSSQNLAKTTEDASVSIKNILNQVENIESKIISQASSMEEIDKTMKNVSENLEETFINVNSVANAIEGTSTNIEEMSVSINEVAKNSDNVFQTTRTSVILANEGVEISKNALIGMENIKNQVNKTANVVGKLNNSTQKINETLTSISEIADQTNLLSLNAAIEAARAGTAGKGFAVVADEVRKLADKTTKATKQIKSMLSSISVETQELVNSMNLALENVDEGNSFAIASSEKLKQIKLGAEKSSDLSSQSAYSMKEQLKNIKKIAQSMNSLQEMSVKIAAMTEQNKISGKEIVSTIENITNTTIEMTSDVKNIEIGTNEITVASDNIASVSIKSAATNEETSQSVKEIVNQMENLTELVSKFKINEN